MTDPASPAAVTEERIEEIRARSRSWHDDTAPANQSCRDRADRIEALEAALREMVYETTHHSPLEPDGSHKCRITAATLANARAALSSTPPAQSAGEAIDPAGRGEVGKLLANLDAGLRECASVRHEMEEFHPGFVESIEQAAALIRAQASALAEARLRVDDALCVIDTVADAPGDACVLVLNGELIGLSTFARRSAEAIRSLTQDPARDV